VQRITEKAAAPPSVWQDDERPMTKTKETIIHKTALVSEKAEIGTGVDIGPYSIIGDHVQIGNDTIVGPHVVIEGVTRIGERCRIFQFCSLGAIPQDLKFKDDHTEVIIGNDNTFRECVTINRGTTGGGGKTVLGNNNFLMAYSHVAHDCKLGNQVIIANSASLAGHIHIEDYAIIGGLVGVHQFVRIGTYAMIGGLSGVSKDLPPYMLAVGERAKLHGINLVGLKRRGISGEAISELKSAYRIIFRSGITLNKAFEKIAEEQLTCAEVQHLVSFIKNSARGIIR
jgi:UDP-N-acetylglucosamine acyltransferase